MVKNSPQRQWKQPHKLNIVHRHHIRFQTHFVVKGVGWGLKTIGKHQPKLVEEYLQETLESKRISKLMLRKATTYLDEKTKERFMERWSKGN